MCPTSEIESETKENFGRKEDPGQIPSMSTQTLMTNRVAMLKEGGETPESSKTRAVRSPDQEMNDLVTGTYGNYLQSPPEQVHDAGMSGFGAAHYHQLQAPQLQAPQRASTSTGISGMDTARVQYTPLDPHNVHKMTSLEETATSLIPCSQCLIMVAMDLSRDVQFIKNELAEGNMTPAGSQGPGSATTHMFPIQLPIANEDDFNEAESLLKNESVRQKMIARLALVGGTNSENLIRRMLATALTNALACRYNWAGKKDKRCSSKKPFKETAIQDCMFAAARQFDRKLTHKDFSETVKKWLRYAPEREGGIPRNTSETNTSETSASPT
ncbi:Gag polyprotein [Dissostichus eleginoides]|uniref:Gag polyprotein n=1 Tax=Dissostichus eleginoides TaxID=100907 RepID=A0AAD9ET22_DISEL|nr:Gag polyprotein [Dissostichus eleginoides]